MSESKAMLKVIKDLVETMTEDQVVKVIEARNRVRDIIDEGHESALGVVLASAEYAVEQES